MYIHTVFRFWWSLVSEQATSKYFLLGAVSFFGNIVSLVNIHVYFFHTNISSLQHPKEKKKNGYIFPFKEICLVLTRIKDVRLKFNRCI